MRIRKFFESIQNIKSSIEDAFENISDTHQIKIIEQNPIQFHIETKKIESITSADEWINLMKEIKESILKSKCDSHEIRISDNQILIIIMYEDTLDYSNSVYIHNDKINIDEDKILRYLEINGFYDTEMVRLSEKSYQIIIGSYHTTSMSEKKSEIMKNLYSNPKIKMDSKVVKDITRDYDGAILSFTHGCPNTILISFWID